VAKAAVLAIDEISMRCPLQQDEPAWVPYGQRSQHYSVDHAENRRVCPYTQRQRDHGYCREARRFHQHPEPVTKILHQLAHCPPPPAARAVRLNSLDFDANRAVWVCPNLCPNYRYGLSLSGKLPSSP